uniref:CWH43-like N-terminal domain-containing protein n=1 Tax=Meloidogyne enterolobii TaxID=390850 RepID=A0A6V7TWQ8_MELEN|nr:unnamed protein product [Meloidogyne enterolobii]
MQTTSISLKCHHQQPPQIPITALNLQKIPEPSKTTKIVIEDYDQTTSYSPPLYDSSTSNSCSPDSSEEASTSYSDEKENNFCKNCFDKKEEIREIKILKQQNGQLDLMRNGKLGRLGIACYLCLAYSFTLQYDRIANFTIPSTMCPYWCLETTKYIWLMVLALHLPPRFFYAIVYKNHYSLGDSIHRTKRWFCVIVKLHYFLLVIEALGLTAVSVIDIESNFSCSRLLFCFMAYPFNLNMLFNNLLHYHSGIRKLRPMHDRVFQIKCALFLVGYPLSMSTGFSYLTFVLTCNTIPYATFSIAEYFLIGINSLFYFLLIWEFDGTKLEVYVKHRKPILVRNQQRMMELRKNKLKNNER